MLIGHLNTKLERHRLALWLSERGVHP